MFKNLTNFSYQRSTYEAVGFYLAYWLLLVVIGSVVGGVLGILIADVAYDNIIKISAVISVGASLTLSYLVLSAKNSLNNFGYLLLALIGGLLALFTGALGGLIAVAFLTTQPISAKRHR